MAARVTLTTNDTSAPDPRCEAKALGEWLKIRCEAHFGIIRQLAGSAKEVTIWLAQPANGSTGGEIGEIVLPMRKGDRRVFQMFVYLHTEYGWGGPVESSIVEERWLSSEEHPTVMIR